MRGLNNPFTVTCWRDLMVRLAAEPDWPRTNQLGDGRNKPPIRMLESKNEMFFHGSVVCILKYL